jgi:hypothetical protein
MGIVDGKVIETTTQLDKPKTVLTIKEKIAFFAVNLGKYPHNELIGRIFIDFLHRYCWIKPGNDRNAFLTFKSI